jgi:beta-lactam-binding protein with PASTA domain
VGAAPAIALVVSSGSASVSVPNVVGDTQPAATTALKGVARR